MGLLGYLKAPNIKKAELLQLLSAYLHSLCHRKVLNPAPKCEECNIYTK